MKFGEILSSQPQPLVKILLVQFPDFAGLHVLQFNVFDGQADQSFTGMANRLDHFPDLMVFALSEADGQPTARHPFMQFLAIGKQSGRLFNQFHFAGLGNVISVLSNRNGYPCPELLDNCFIHHPPHLDQVFPEMRHLALEKQSGDPPVCSQQQQSF